jgi:hypothetical protein
MLNQAASAAVRRRLTKENRNPKIPPPRLRTYAAVHNYGRPLAAIAASNQPSARPVTQAKRYPTLGARHWSQPVPIDHAAPADDPAPPDRPRPPDTPQSPDKPPRPADAADRAAAHHAYRAKVDQAYAADRSWTEAVPSLRAAWEKHQEQYPERGRPTPHTHPDNSWSSGDRKLSPDQNAAVDRNCATIQEIGARDIVPKMLALESQVPDRHLVGFDHHIKGSDRLKEKVAERVSVKERTVSETLANIPDAVRFTFQYSETAYTAGVREDVKRLADQGFIQVELRNTWADKQYKGINSRWREPRSGVLFEVQFHTQASLEAKELTHGAYERIRDPLTSKAEESVLKAYQRQVNDLIASPPDVFTIENYPPEKRDA